MVTDNPRTGLDRGRVSTAGRGAPDRARAGTFRERLGSAPQDSAPAGSGSASAAAAPSNERVEPAPGPRDLDLVVSDDEGRLLAGWRYTLELPRGEREEGTLGPDARLHREGLEAGEARQSVSPP